MEYDITIELSADVGHALTQLMSDWKKMTGKIENSSKFSNDHVLGLAHQTTKYKLEHARMYLSILKACYNVKRIPSIDFMVRAMTDNIFSNLSSALDSISYEINQAYGFKIKIEKIQINHHRMHQLNEGDCIRCKLNNIPNDNLSKFLNTELPRDPIPSNHWYCTFSKYRNQVVHRPLYLIHLATEGRFLPDDPSVMNPIVTPYYDPKQHKILIPNYTENREIKDYCEDCLNKVLCVIEKTYEYLDSKIC